MAAPYQATTSLWSTVARIAAVVDRLRRPDLDLDGRAGGLEQAAQRGHRRPGLVELAFQPLKVRGDQGAAGLRVGGRRAPRATSRTGMPSSRNRRITWAVGTCVVA